MPGATYRPFRGCSVVLLHPSRVEVFTNYSVISRVGRLAARLCSGACLFFLALGLGIVTFLSGTAVAKASTQRYQYSLPRMGTIFRIEMYAAPSRRSAKSS